MSLTGTRTKSTRSTSIPAVAVSSFTCCYQSVGLDGRTRKAHTTSKRRRQVGASSTDRTLHLQLDQPVHLDRILERQFLRDRLDEAGHDQRRGLRLGETARHQVEELLLPDLGHSRLVADVDLVLVD